MPSAYGTTVLALDNVPVELPVARAGSRSLAALLDYSLWFLTMAVLALVTLMVILITGLELGTWLWAGLVLIYLVLDWAFFASQEVLMQGQTLGKRVTGLRVLGVDGGRASIQAMVLRNFVRAIDLLLALPFLIFDPRARRLGDRLAGTLVVHEGATQREIAVRRAPRGWGAAEIALVESFVERAEDLDVEHARSLAKRILSWASRDDPAFMESVPEVFDPVTRVLAAFQSDPEAQPDQAQSSVPPPPPPANS